MFLIYELFLGLSRGEETFDFYSDLSGTSVLSLRVEMGAHDKPAHDARRDKAQLVTHLDLGLSGRGLLGRAGAWPDKEEFIYWPYARR